MTKYTEHQELCSIYSDVYKDAYGCRPHCDLSHLSVDELRQEIDSMAKVAQAQYEAELRQENLNAFAFEARVKELIQVGAKTRDNAIRWLHEAHDTNGDNDFLAWTLNLPYKYLES